MDDEPNLYIGNGWKSPFPSIYKWLFGVPGINYIDFLQATRHHLVFFLRANLTRSSSPTTATCFWSPRRSSDGRTSASGTAFFVRGLDDPGHQFSLLWYSPCPAPQKKQVANNINYPAKMREHIVKKQPQFKKTRSTKQPPFETKKVYPPWNEHFRPLKIEGWKMKFRPFGVCQFSSIFQKNIPPFQRPVAAPSKFQTCINPTCWKGQRNDPATGDPWLIALNARLDGNIYPPI